MLFHRPTRRLAHTLTEILVVIAIIFVLAALGYSSFVAAVSFGKKQEMIADAARTQLARTPGAAADRDAPLANPAIPEMPAPNVVSMLAASAATGRATSVTTLPMPANGEPAPFIPQEYVVTFAGGVRNSRAEADRLASQYGGRVLSVYSRVIPGCGIFIPDEAYAAFRADAAIASVVPNYRAFATQQGVPAGVRRIFSSSTVPANQFVLARPPALQPATGGSFVPRRNLGEIPSIHVAIMDSGIDSKHPDLNVVVSRGFGGLPDGEDENGHGTHVAGTVGAVNNGRGVVGVYPGAPLWSVRVLGANGSGSAAGVLEGLQFVHDNAGRIRVCNMSLGFPTVVPPINALVDACADRGIVMVAAAGNSAVLASTGSPGSAKRAICVAAMGDSDGRPGGKGPKTGDGPDDTFASFSNFGPTVAVIAPGVDILSTLPNNSYGKQQGTSMAAPHVAGVCAVLLDPNTQYPSSRNLDFPGLVRRPTPSTLNAAYLRSMATEFIPGIKGDKLKYPMINFKVK